MKVLGIDPGSHRTGWGVITASGSCLKHISSGTIEPRVEPLAQRLCAIAAGLDTVMQEHQPEAVAVEAIFHARNAKSALLLGHARGVAILCAARFGVPVYEYAATQVKQAVTGRGRADKNQVQTMVKLILSLTGHLGLDTSDALAVAICHTHFEQSPVVKLLAEKTRLCSKNIRAPRPVGRSWSGGKRDF